jgi:hypothetical protein
MGKMNETMAGTERRALGALTCPSCRNPLTIAGVTRLSFLCRSGHALLIEDILRLGSDSVRPALEDVLQYWDQKCRLLTLASERARAQGYGDVALSFLRESRQVAARALLLRDSLRRNSTASLA